MLRFATVLFCLVVAFSAMGAGTVSVVSPAELKIALTGEVATLRVYYTTTTKTKITVTDAGPLAASHHIGFAPDPAPPKSMQSFVVRVKAPSALLRPGDSATASLVFRDARDDAALATHTLTITREKPSFTAAVIDADVCLLCDDPRSITVQITNSGTVPIHRLDVGLLEMKDGKRHSRLQVPAKGSCPQTNVLWTHNRIPPCGKGLVSIAPGQQEKIVVPFVQPPRAGDYTVTFDIRIPNVQTAGISAVVHTRGPRGDTWWPLLLFSFWVLAGAAIARLLEWYYGSGGGRARAKAQLKLYEMQQALRELLEYATDDPRLKVTRPRVAGDLALLERAIAGSPSRKQTELDEEVTTIGTRLEKRLRLQQKVEYAKANGLEDRIEKLDQAPDDGTVDAYTERLAQILAGTAENAPVRSASLRESEVPTAARLSFIDWLLQRVRGLTLAAVSLAIAYMLLFDGECSYGSPIDYINTFLWGLGLTQAGNAVIGEAISKYTKPQKP